MPEESNPEQGEGGLQPKPKPDMGTWNKGTWGCGAGVFSPLAWLVAGVGFPSSWERGDQ